ncbi:MAG: PTS system mannose/fructose/sorbose family transporter subunit IID [[Clostridium] innocuum]
MIENITKAASILGLMVIGAMIASTVSISIPFEIGVKAQKNQYKRISIK